MTLKTAEGGFQGFFPLYDTNSNCKGRICTETTVSGSRSTEEMIYKTLNKYGSFFTRLLCFIFINIIITRISLLSVTERFQRKKDATKACLPMISALRAARGEPENGPAGAASHRRNKSSFTDTLALF